MKKVRKAGLSAAAAARLNIGCAELAYDDTALREGI